MSDPKYGEPVDDSTADAGSVDDVVGRAHEGLAEAEAASRDAVSDEELAQMDAGDRAVADGDDTPQTRAEAKAATGETPVAPAADTTDAGMSDADLDAAYAEAGYVPAATAPAAEPAGTPEPQPAATEDVSVAASEPAASEPLYRPDAERDTAVYAGAATAGTAATGDAVTASEPVAPATAYATPQPIFVQAPEAPRPRGNRGAAGAIGLLAAVSFGVLYLAAALGFGLGDGSITIDTLGQEALGALTTWWFWVPVVVFFLGFWLLGAIINRGRWGYWVIFGLLVGAVSYGGHLLGQLFQAPFWTLTAQEGADLVDSQLLAPLAIVAFIIGRELTIWFGAWVAARGRRVTELNREAQREYERTLEAGPQLHQG
ncbi:ABC transporter [Microbacterium sp. MC2]